ncbi:hypothetical protein MKX01_042767 [Papaver californicum]|nr:hypothetical protein MKX01_042767 [Papaver californicum]
MSLKVYVDRMSQPSRAVLIFCNFSAGNLCAPLVIFFMVIGIEFEEIKVDLVKKEHRLPEFKVINPFGQVPSIADGDFKLFEGTTIFNEIYVSQICACHAIISYLACASPSVADHWYPSDLQKRAKINSVLDWHHSNLRRGGGLVEAAAEAEKVLTSSLSKIESVWLNENGDFLLGNKEPSIADISLVCEIMQFEFLHEQDRIRVLTPFKKVLKWIEDTRIATNPHFEEVHKALLATKSFLHKLPVDENYETASSIKSMLDMEIAAEK